jgi:hypothetical protein
MKPPLAIVCIEHRPVVLGGKGRDDVITRMLSTLFDEGEEVVVEFGHAVADRVCVEVAEGLDKAANFAACVLEPVPSVGWEAKQPVDQLAHRWFVGVDLLRRERPGRSGPQAGVVGSIGGERPAREVGAHRRRQPAVLTAGQHQVGDRCRRAIGRAQDLLDLVVAEDEPLTVGAAVGDLPVGPHTVVHRIRPGKSFLGERIPPFGGAEQCP